MSRYIKTIASILGGVSTWGITAAADNAITQVELFGLLGVLSTVLAVYAFPNSPPAGEAADPNVSERDAHPTSLVGKADEPNRIAVNTQRFAEARGKKAAPVKKAAKKR